MPASTERPVPPPRDTTRLTAPGAAEDAAIGPREPAPRELVGMGAESDTAPARGAADQVLRAISRHWKIAALIAAAVTVVAYLVAAAQPKQYQAVSTGAVTPVVKSDMTPSDVMRSVDMLDRRVVVGTVAALANTPLTLSQVRATASDKIDGAVVPSTNLVNVTVMSRSAARAAALANGIPASLNAQTRSMFVVYGVVLISPAAVPQKAALPRVERAVIGGLILGLVVGAGVAYLLDRRLRAR
jgi:capsular polysaccharide biosynthesis protein